CNLRRFSRLHDNVSKEYDLNEMLTARQAFIAWPAANNSGKYPCRIGRVAISDYKGNNLAQRRNVSVAVIREVSIDR
ncbi:MAG: hypothetical protein NTW52_20030, partial [Planctomycetota bacterium]|nr:hypothetical protein [Planctomycetota bacterium]